MRILYTEIKKQQNTFIMDKKEPTTIKGYAMKYAPNYGIILTEELYQRYYRRYYRKFGGWGNKWYAAFGILDSIRRDREMEEQKEEARRVGTQ